MAFQIGTPKFKLNIFYVILITWKRLLLHCDPLFFKKSAGPVMEVNPLHVTAVAGFA